MPLPSTKPPKVSARVKPLTLTTSGLCTAAGVTRGMLRLYEREGLIEAPKRTAAGYRNYPAADTLRLQAIRSLKEIGFTLKEIALLLDERDQGEMDPQRMRELAQAQLAVIDIRVARLAMVRSYMAAVAAGDTALIDDPDCNFLLDFMAAGGDKAAGTAVPSLRTGPALPTGSAVPAVPTQAGTVPARGAALRRPVPRPQATPTPD
jgi:MerR family transcriptional regulator, copper efflux regulator